MSEVKERPLLFSPPMIRVLLEGRKTQTRRIVKADFHHGHAMAKITPIDSEFLLERWPEAERSFSNFGRCDRIQCPYGVVGDRIWVKESYCFAKFWEAMGIDDWAATVHYPADGADRQIYQCDAPDDVGFWPGAVIRKYEGKRLPSIFMYRWVSRITLEIIDVRIERVQDISEEDAIAEGVDPLFDLETAKAMPECDLKPMPWRNYLFHGLIGKTITTKQSNDWQHQFSSYKTAAGSYSSLWESINGEGSWAANPWVWVVEFRRVDGRL